MSDKPKASGLSSADKASLLQRLTNRRPASGAPARASAAKPQSPPDDIADFEFHKQMQVIRSVGEILDIANPFFRVHEGIAAASTVIEGRKLINFASYNYLGFNGHPRVSAAAKAAIDRYGTSVSAARLGAGERGIHRELERALAEIHGAEDCVAFVSGHATNVTVIGHVLGKNDLILHDALSHNSILQGAQLSGARRLSFPHNDVEAAERLLVEQRGRHNRVLVVIEGHYSMDGDIPDLPAFSALSRRHRAWLFVDEAHSLGVLGARGFGIAEHFGLEADAADFWMGTLSKTLAGCGGYVAGRRELMEYLRYSAPGFLYSVGMPPPVAAAAVEALNVMREEPERVARLNANTGRFRARAIAAGLDTGLSGGYSIVPIITGSSIVAGRLADAIFRRGVNAQPILHPAVPERSARLRFFLSADHTEEDIDQAVTILAEENARVRAQKIDLASLALKLGRAGM